jgi:hypothetical protein
MTLKASVSEGDEKKAYQCRTWLHGSTEYSLSSVNESSRLKQKMPPRERHFSIGVRRQRVPQETRSAL